MQTRAIYCCLLLFLLAYTNLFGQADKIAEINKLLTLKDEAYIKALDDFSSQYYFGLLFNTNKSLVETNYLLSDTLKAYWALIEKIISITPEEFRDRFGATRSLEHIIYDMIKIAGDSEFSKLLEYYQTIPDSNYYKFNSFLFTLCNGWIKREIDKIIQNKINSESNLMPMQSYDVPSALESVSSELQEDWLLFNSFRDYYKYRLDQDTTCQWYYVQKHYDLFQKKVEEILLSDSPEQLNEVMRFRWGGWCGTGSEGFYSEQQMAVLMILIRTRDFSAILGNPNFTDNIGYKNFRKLIELCDHNWINYYTGIISDGKFCNLSPEFYRQGGDKAAQMLIKLKNYKFKDVYQQKCYLGICSHFLKKEKKYDYFPNIDFYANPFYADEYKNDFENRVAISEKTKDELINVIIEIGNDENNIDIAKTVIRIFENLEFNQKIKIQLLNYTNSEYKFVRDGAAKILKKNGIVVSLPEDDGKIKFRLLVDGNPLTNFDLGYELENSSSSFGYQNGNGRTTDKGIFNLNKDELLETNKENPKIRFRSNSGAGKSQIFFFCTEMIIPNNISDTIDVFIATGNLRINFEFNRDKDFYEDKQLSIYFSGTNCQLHYIELTSILQDSYILPLKIQKGEYFINVSIPGSIDWHNFIEINSDTTTQLVNLEFGTSVKFKIKAPGGEKADNEVSFKLIQNNITDDFSFSHYDYILEGYEPLPIGTYTLKIFSSEEKKVRIKENSRNSCDEIIPDYVDYEGKEISFTIDTNSPEFIDLGLIELTQSND